MGIESIAFEPWYRAEHPRVLASMAVVVRDVEVARDITAEAFARALERWNRVGEMASPGGWTYQVALNLARRRVRRATLERRLLLRAAPSPVSVPAPAIDVWEAVTALPPRMRTAVALRYLGGLTEAEVATTWASPRAWSPPPCMKRGAGWRRSCPPRRWPPAC